MENLLRQQGHYLTTSSDNTFFYYKKGAVPPTGRVVCSTTISTTRIHTSIISYTTTRDIAPWSDCDYDSRNSIVEITSCSQYGSPPLGIYIYSSYYKTPSILYYTSYSIYTKTSNQSTNKPIIKYPLSNSSSLTITNLYSISASILSSYDRQYTCTQLTIYSYYNFIANIDNDLHTGYQSSTFSSFTEQFFINSIILYTSLFTFKYCTWSYNQTTIYYYTSFTGYLNI